MVSALATASRRGQRGQASLRTERLADRFGDELLNRDALLGTVNGEMPLERLGDTGEEDQRLCAVVIDTLSPNAGHLSAATGDGGDGGVYGGNCSS